MHRCKCFDRGFKLGMDYADILQFVNGKDNVCTFPLFLCPNVDKELRRADEERKRRSYYSKRLKKAGYSQEEIDRMPVRKRRSRNRVHEIDDS